MDEARDKLSDLAAHSRITDPAELERKKAVVAAALERAQARRNAPRR
jgi:electron transport complex protein RnfB